MQILLNEQDLINSVATWVAWHDNGNDFEDISPEDSYDVRLFFNKSIGFSAEGNIYRRHYHLNEQKVVDAVVIYLQFFHNYIPERLNLELLFNDEEGFSANVIVN